MKLKLPKMIRKTVNSSRKNLVREFENDVLSDQARAVFMTVNARLLNKYNSL